MSPADIESALQWRYATKKFDPSRKISEKDWHALQMSLHLAPSSYGLQGWKFLIVQSPQLRQALRPVSWNQSQIEDCSHLVVFTTCEKITEEHIQAHIDQTASVRQIQPDGMKGYRDFMVQKIVKEMDQALHKPWLQRQAYIAMGFLLETAALLKIDSCPIEGIEPEKYDKILNLDGSGYKTVAVVALGYRHSQDEYQKAAKSRFPTSRIIQYI